MRDCVFCKIIKGEVPSKKVYEDKLVYAFYDINPQAPVHILIVPKKHIENLASTTVKERDYLAQCQLAAGKIARKMRITKAFRVLVANGIDAGQTVFHLHYHLIGGWKRKSPRMEVKPGSLVKT